MQQTTDRRVRRTRKLLQDALLGLLLHKPIEDISVKELAEAADVARATVYVHFRDAVDVLQQLEQALYEELSSILGSPAQRADLLQEIFAFVLKNRTTFEALLGDTGDHAFIEQLRALCVERAAASQMVNGVQESARVYQAVFLVGGYESLLRRWLYTGCKETPEEMVRLAEKVF